MTRKLLLLVLLACSLVNAQQFSSETAAAHDAVTNLSNAAESKVAALVADNAALSAQLTSLRQLKTYTDLEWMFWHMNCAKQVGGSGLGVGSQTTAPGATLTITPNAPVAGAPNYFDCYFHADVSPDDNAKSFSFATTWTFPTAADSGASQALEMEIRQSVTGGKQGVCALQMNFSSNQLRIFDHIRKWFAIGVPMPRLTAGVSYPVTLECHRDEAFNVVYDAVTISGTRFPLSYTYPYWQDNWRPMLRVARQLDGRGTGTPYTVKSGTTTLQAWQ